MKSRVCEGCPKQVTDYSLESKACLTCTLVEQDIKPNGSRCRSCPGQKTNGSSSRCWFDNSPCGLLSDILMGFKCDHYEFYKLNKKMAEDKCRSTEKQ